MKLKILFAGLILFALTLSSYSKANADPERFNIEYCITVDSQEAISIDIQAVNFEKVVSQQLLNPGRMYLAHVGKEVYEFNFIYKTNSTNYRHYKALKPPAVE